VYAPVVTPFDDDLVPDLPRYVNHCRWLLSQEMKLAIFGTNSEADSLSVGEKISMLAALVDSGIALELVMPGTGCAALTDSIELTKHAVARGCKNVFMLPHFFTKGCPMKVFFVVIPR